RPDHWPWRRDRHDRTWQACRHHRRRRQPAVRHRRAVAGRSGDEGRRDLQRRTYRASIVVRTTTAVVSLFVMALSSAAASAQAPAAEPDLEHPQNTNAGIFAFTGRCAGCHDNATNGAANRAELVKHTPEAVLASITSGRMAQYAT